MFEISSFYPPNKTVIKTLPTFVEAENYARQNLDIVFFERDLEVNYLAADMITKQGEIYSIQPVVQNAFIEEGRS